MVLGYAYIISQPVYRFGSSNNQGTSVAALAVSNFEESIGL
jgi:hypothetical protein